MERSESTACYYSADEYANGTPVLFYMHCIGHIAGGVGPTGSITSKSVSIKIPRSKRVQKIHLLAFLIKLCFTLVGIAFYISFKPFDNPVLNALPTLIILLTGGLIVVILYKVKGVKSRSRYSKQFPVVADYKLKGYKPGFHSVVSTTPIGIIINIFRWLL